MNNDPVIGAKIIGARQMTKAEMVEEGWDYSRPEDTTVLILSTGAILYASADWEGNGPGVIFGKSNDDGFYIDNSIKK